MPLTRIKNFVIDPRNVIANIIAPGSITSTDIAPGVLGTIACQDSNNVSITGGDIKVSSIYLTGSFTDTVSIQSPTDNSVINLDPTITGILYLPQEALSDIDVNINGISKLNVRDSVTLTLILTNGAEAYVVKNIMVDSGNITSSIKWLGGAHPGFGNPNSTDIYTFNIIKTGDTSCTVFSSQARFG